MRTLLGQIVRDRCPLSEHWLTVPPLHIGNLCYLSVRHGNPQRVTAQYIIWNAKLHSNCDVAVRRAGSCPERVRVDDCGVTAVHPQRIVRPIVA